MKKFRVSFICRDDKLSTLVALLSNEVGELTISEDGGNGKVPHKRRVSREGSALHAIKKYLATVRGKDITVKKDLARALVAAGFSETSCTPMSTALVREGLASRVSKGVLKIK